jgi:hypothetical protein
MAKYPNIWLQVCTRMPLFEQEAARESKKVPLWAKHWPKHFFSLKHSIILILGILVLAFNYLEKASLVMFACKINYNLNSRERWRHVDSQSWNFYTIYGAYEP